jgi:tRNA threonylcarbamoyladenosine biosynthesis protein TsaE
MELIVYGSEALPSLMLHVFDALAGRRKVALYGEMGAGKTTLIKAICAHLGVADNTASPTYSLINAYAYTDADGQAALFHHLDLYRLRNLREALDIGLEELLDDPWYCFIEWPEIVEDLLPPETARIYVDVTGETTRLVRVV